MGLFTGLVTLPLAPVRGVAWVVEQVASEAERELYDEGEIRRQLLALELEFDDGLITEQERRHREEELLGRLAASRERSDWQWEGSREDG
jgi:hypothetical protein